MQSSLLGSLGWGRLGCSLGWLSIAKSILVLLAHLFSILFEGVKGTFYHSGPPSSPRILNQEQQLSTEDTPFTRQV